MLFVCLFVLSQALSFKDWQDRHDKKYNNIVEYLYRRAVFMKNAKFVKENPGAELNVFADLYNLAPLGVYEIVFDFGDITYNREEDRARWYGYAMQNKIPFWYYLVKFEGMTEEEAKSMVAEAQPKETMLFGGVNNGN